MSEDEKKNAQASGVIEAPPTIEDIGVGFVNGITPEGQAKMAEEIMRLKPESITGKPARKALFWESITEVKDPASGARIRVWRKVAECPEYNEVEILVALQKTPVRAGMKEIFDVLSSIEGVTAIELTDPMGCGGLMYLDW